ncbi:hypothetical protein [Leisingera sp. M658]|uniref:COG3904 family protein n=1 Tax=Leisingera sp. M658 TaxID=2867015 RepID=UPI0021A3BD58|nr:hypothetical protein [Leisingera sp. M658]UWQ76139.1 hypothetical protein K3724_06800 [Leisingera sp. M658]
MPAPASLRRSLGLQVLLPRAGVVVIWLALNQWVSLPVPLVFVLMAADGLFLLWQARIFQHSADAHVRSTGAMAPVWGGYLVLLFAGFAAVTLWWDAQLIARAKEEPVYAEQRRQAREALYRLTVSNDGRALIFAGEITFGLTRRIEQMILQHPGLQRITLTSPGGLIAEARGAARLIREQGFSTRAEGLCASACTLMFAAGLRRSLGGNGQLGFHSYALQFESGLPQINLEKEQEKDRAFLLQQGVSAEFANRVFAIPHREIWIPDATALRIGGVVTE